MIVLQRIPVDLSPQRLADFADPAGEIPDAFVRAYSPLIRPAGCFDEVSPEVVFGHPASTGDWGRSVIIGLCGLGAGAAEAEPPEADRPLWASLTGLALRDALDFLEYRVRLYLKPSGTSPGGRMVPGCEGLPAPAERAILDHFGPENRPGLTLTPSGAIDARTGLAFAYPTSEKARTMSQCDQCTRKDCPARLL